MSRLKFESIETFILRVRHALPERQYYFLAISWFFLLKKKLLRFEIKDISNLKLTERKECEETRGLKSQPRNAIAHSTHQFVSPTKLKREGYCLIQFEKCSALLPKHYLCRFPQFLFVVEVVKLSIDEAYDRFGRLRMLTC